MKKYFLFFTALFVLLILSSGVRAQFVWDVVKSNNDWRYQNGFQALNCRGDNCTAAGTVFDFLYDAEIMMFWHSTDGGITWTMHDPHFPFFHDDSHNIKNIFTGVQQIDSLNAVAIGQYGVIFRTFDGGEIWERQDSKTQADLVSVHFSDPMTGIFTSQATASDPVNGIFTTYDGGRNWKSIRSNLDPLSFQDIAAGSTVSQCHSFGNGKFSVFKSGYGPIWSTSDNWKTVQDTHVLIDSTTDSSWQRYSFNDCRFKGMDTIIAFGLYISTVYLAAITRSTDGGLHWDKPFKSFIDSSNHFYTWDGGVNDMTEFRNDTVLAATFDLPRLLQSTDAGKTWIAYGWQLDTTYNITQSTGLCWTKSGPIEILGNGIIRQNSLIIKGSIARSSVPSARLSDTTIHLYPNPAISEVHIRLNAAHTVISIFDMLGREVRRKLSGDSPEVTFDLRGLSNGMYTVISDKKGLIGKLMISGE